MNYLHSVNKTERKKKKCKTKGNTHFRPSSAPVFLHHRGLCFGWKTVDCDGNVGVFEHLLQNHRHSPPLQSIQATADAVDEKVGKKKETFFLNCSRNKRDTDKVALNHRGKLNTNRGIDIFVTSLRRQ